MELNKSQKFVKIVELMQRRGGIRAHEIMGRFELDPRTMRRYLSDLRELGLPIHDTGIGAERVVALDPSYRRAGVQLTLSEVLSLHFGRKLFTFLEGTQFAADMDDAIERLEPAISRAQADLARQLDRKFMAVPEHAKDYRAMGDLIDDLITALIYDNPIRAEYTKLSGENRVYTLDPLTLATYRQGLYLIARDQGDGRTKTFAIERFSQLSRLRLEHFEPPEDYDPEARLRDAFGIINAPPVKVTATFNVDAAPYVAERAWHHSQSLETLPDGRLRCHFEVGITQELVNWFLGFGSNVIVEEPAALVDRLRNEYKAAVEQYR